MRAEGGGEGEGRGSGGRRGLAAAFLAAARVTDGEEEWRCVRSGGVGCSGSARAAPRGATRGHSVSSRV
jgi:hypothetical protein